jgi:hypothetical protein
MVGYREILGGCCVIDGERIHKYSLWPRTGCDFRRTLLATRSGLLETTLPGNDGSHRPRVSVATSLTPKGRRESGLPRLRRLSGSCHAARETGAAAKGAHSRFRVCDDSFGRIANHLAYMTHPIRLELRASQML